MSKSSKLPFFVSVPHSGEKVPQEVVWLQGLDEPTLMRDVDRFVDQLYQPSISKYDLDSIITEWHRYVVDLNRIEDEFDSDSVEGALFTAGEHPKGLHWSVTTVGEQLITTPMTMELHNKIVEDYYKPFHDKVSRLRDEVKQRSGVVYHLDLHSMPSVGTSLHPDPGEKRAEVVISDNHGHSAEAEYRDIVIKAYQEVGFEVGYNWPYFGGGITKRYGEPEKAFHTLQVELNRSLYMDEVTKQKVDDKFNETQQKLEKALGLVIDNLRKYLGK